MFISLILFYQANSSRLVTKIRWIVESVNGRLKQWKYLQNVVPNTQIPYIREYVCLIAALCNKYRDPLNTGNPESDQILAAKMKVGSYNVPYDLLLLLSIRAASEAN